MHQITFALALFCAAPCPVEMALAGSGTGGDITRVKTSIQARRPPGETTRGELTSGIHQITFALALFCIAPMFGRNGFTFPSTEPFMAGMMAAVELEEREL